MSVIIPLYGQHRGQTSLESVSKAWLAQDVPCEVVVAVAGAIPVRLAADVDAHRVARVTRADGSARAPGLLRNIGARCARAPILYLSDADVLPLGRDFLTRAMKVADTAAFTQPWMHRLIGDSGPNPVDLRAPEPGQCCYVRATKDGRLKPQGDEQLIPQLLAIGGVDIDAPTVIPPRVVFDQHPTSKGDWRVPFHWGGLMLERQLFENVGGYCRRYYGWGCEDDDLLVKVAARHTITRAWQVDTTLTCLHFDHTYPYRGTPERNANIARYTERLAAGPTAMIEEDAAVLRKIK
ncbi:glycosyltransferase family 2 protein [Saccharopolyspora antimicrobica]|uniref:glycosyltransferase family 2 protein n=1 Tax=Saccharopolyspora antimicrobica TaxID=455193 RepID=UPI0014772103|nr:glycosyltransferase family 2 protein [Saccharopolyspora antimicrobica]